MELPTVLYAACELVAQAARRTVWTMLVGAGLSRSWSHHRAHCFFSHSRWLIEQVSAVEDRLVLRPTVAINDTLFHCRVPKVQTASWFQDGSALGEANIGYGNICVILATVVRLAHLDRPVALPVCFALVRKKSDYSSRLALARQLIEALAAALPGRRLHVVADSAYAGKALRDLPGSLTWTTRLQPNASLYELAPVCSRRRGRSRLQRRSSPTSLPSLPA